MVVFGVAGCVPESLSFFLFFPFSLSPFPLLYVGIEWDCDTASTACGIYMGSLQDKFLLLSFFHSFTSCCRGWGRCIVVLDDASPGRYASIFSLDSRNVASSHG